MKYKINKNFPYALDMKILNEELNLKNRKPILEKVKPLYLKTREITRPKCIFFQAEITEKDEQHVKVDDELFESELFRGYVDKNDFVYPYIVTVGTELDEYAKTLNDPSDQFMIDEIMNLIVNIGKVFVMEEVKKTSGWKDAQDYVPGNGEDWSTVEQTRLFKMFAGETDKIGVSLGDHAFVLPGRSTIGILSEKK